jgi:putative membrane protein
MLKRWRTWAALIFVPVLVMGLLTWAFWSPEVDHGTATAAVVNNDEPVTVNGQIIPLGRELAGNLTHDADSAYTWVLTDADDAASGLAHGTYAAVVTIPADFSARATSTATGKPLDATRAVLSVRTSANAGVIDPSLSRRIAEATQDALNRQVVETYLDNVYVSFSTIHDKLGQAADGAGQLADGTDQLVPGSRQLADGSGELHTAAAALADGASRLATGTGQLTTGSAQLADGLSQAERDTAQLPELTRQLADGAEQVAQGNEKLASALAPLADRIIAAIDGLPSTQDLSAQLQSLSSMCSGDPVFCSKLRDAASQLAAQADQVDAAKASVRANALAVRNSIQALATGARQVADGNAKLADEAVPLTAGIATAAQGAESLDAGIRDADAAAGKLAAGSKQLAAGAGNLATGAGQLNDGAVAANDGAHRLADELDRGRDQIPDYTDAERQHLKSVAADPTAASGDGVEVGTLALTLFAALALWVLALAAYIITSAVPSDVLTARMPSWRIILRAAVPGFTAAGLAALAITVIASLVQGLTVTESFGFLGVAVLAAFAFIALNQAATAIFPSRGRLASVAVLVLTAATGVVSTLPSALSWVSGVLPTHGAIVALRAVSTGGPGLVRGVVELCAWLAVGVFAAVVVTDRRRYLSARQLRLGDGLAHTTV